MACVTVLHDSNVIVEKLVLTIDDSILLTTSWVASVGHLRGHYIGPTVEKARSNLMQVQKSAI